MRTLPADICCIRLLRSRTTKKTGSSIYGCTVVASEQTAPRSFCVNLAWFNQHLRQHIAQRRKFFDNKERLQKLKGLVSPEDLEIELDRKMLAVVVKADQAELFNIVQTLFHAMAEGDSPDLEAVPTVWAQIERFDLDEPFWTTIKSAFGYDEETPTLKNLLVRLLVSDYAHYLTKELPGALRHLELPPSVRCECSSLPGTMERQQQQGEQLQRACG